MAALHRFKRLVRSIIPDAPPPVAAAPPTTASVLDWYVQTAPDPQRTLDIFKGEWASTLPAPFGHLEAGPVPLFNDPRLVWGAERLGHFRDRTVLELGPLEGGHSWMMVNMGAASVTAVEANTHAFLKCLIVKEMLNTPRTRFLCGDFIAYLEEEQRRYDIVLASGVLYHMRDPVHLIDLISRATDRVFLWTHYYDPEICGAAGSPRFPVATETESQGFRHTLYRHEYLHLLRNDTFCGGGATFSNWLTRDDIFGALRHFGFKQIDTAFEEPHHQGGPAFALAAQRA
jgi:hypothetical protein